MKKLMTFDEFVLNESKKISGKRLNESEESNPTGDAKDITDYALYRYGVFSDSGVVKTYLQNITVKEFTKMDKKAQVMFVRYFFLLCLPGGKSLKGLGNVPQSSSEIQISEGAEDYDFSANDTELIVKDKNGYPIATIETKDVADVLSQNITQLPCAIIVGTAKNKTTLGGLTKKLEDSKDNKEFRDTATDVDYVNKGKSVSDLTVNVDTNINSEAFKEVVSEYADSFVEKEKDEKYVKLYSPSQSVVNEFPAFKKASDEFANRRKKGN